MKIKSFQLGRLFSFKRFLWLVNVNDDDEDESEDKEAEGKGKEDDDNDDDDDEADTKGGRKMMTMMIKRVRPRGEEDDDDDETKGGGIKSFLPLISRIIGPPL